jgi:hypothetical protein
MSSDEFFSGHPILMIGALVFAGMILAAGVGILARNRHDRRPDPEAKSDENAAFVASAVLGLLALLMGFSFSLAIDRFETRRVLILEEANAIGTAYLRTQLLEQPHRARIGQLLIDYTGNRLALAKASDEEMPALISKDEAMTTDLWAATSAAFVTIQGLDFSSAYLESINNLIDLDAARKAATMARIPSEVFAILVIYLIATSAVLGYVLVGVRGRVAAGFTLMLLTTSFLLIVDIDRPGRGGIIQSQRPIEALHKSLISQPPEIYDRYRG